MHDVSNQSQSEMYEEDNENQDIQSERNHLNSQIDQIDYGYQTDTDINQLIVGLPIEYRVYNQINSNQPNYINSLGSRNIQNQINGNQNY